MKTNRKTMSALLSITVAGLMTASISHAATIPMGNFAFTPATANTVLQVKSKGWSDPAFGGMGWTHSSAWGNFQATKGQIITISMSAANPGIHPGGTVWYRGPLDTAPDNYVVDHFYAQDGSAVKMGATDESTGVALGNIVMKHVIHGYDADNITMGEPTLNGKKDNKPGVLVLRFKAPYSGAYTFVTGGIDPDAGIDTALIYKIKVRVGFGVVPVVTP